MMSSLWSVLLYTILLEDMNPAQITPLTTSILCNGMTPRPFTAENCAEKAEVTAAPMLLLTFPVASNPVKKKLCAVKDEAALQG